MLAWLVLQGLRGSEKLKHGALSLYMGNGIRAVVKAIKSFDLVLPTRILNMVPTKKVERTPYGTRKLPIVLLKGLGLIPKGNDGLLLLLSTQEQIFVARNVEFFENSLMIQEASRSHGLLKLSGSDGVLELIQEKDTQPFENTSEVHNEVEPIEVEPQNVKVPIRRFARIPQAPDRYGFYVDVEEYEIAEIKKIGFTQNLDEPCVYLKASRSNVAFLILYFDDILLMGNNVTMLQEVKSLLCLIMYAVRCTRPDVVFTQNLCSRFQQNLIEIHWTAVKTILKYLRNTKDMKSANQSTTAMSSIETEYTATAEASMEVIE
ncbi:hypothetical protein Tco_0962397 [Tanacetum coccineum]